MDSVGSGYGEFFCLTNQPLPVELETEAGGDLALLIRAAHEGWGTERGEHAYAEVVGALYEQTFRLARRYLGNLEDAREVTNSAFCSAWCGLRRHDLDERSFRRWLLRIVKNAAIDEIRKRKSRIVAEVEHSGDVAERVAAPPVDLDLGIDLDRLVGEMPTVLREVFRLRFLEADDIRTIAEKMGRCPRWVNAAIWRLREHLRVLR